MEEIIITSSQEQDKEWRKMREWYKDGKHNECEIYQRDLVKNITHQQCCKTNMRINIITNIFESNSHPMKKEDGFEWSENFDGCINFQSKEFYFNFKMVCDVGGAQTRTLREVYHFIESQLKFLITSNQPDLYFVNILDGNSCYMHRKKYDYLINKPMYETIKCRVFVGDMLQFHQWWRHLFHLV